MNSGTCQEPASATPERLHPGASQNAPFFKGMLCGHVLFRFLKFARWSEAQHVQEALALPPPPPPFLVTSGVSQVPWYELLPGTHLFRSSQTFCVPEAEQSRAAPGQLETHAGGWSSRQGALGLAPLRCHLPQLRPSPAPSLAQGSRALDAEVAVPLPAWRAQASGVW